MRMGMVAKRWKNAGQWTQGRGAPPPNLAQAYGMNFRRLDIEGTEC